MKVIHEVSPQSQSVRSYEAVDASEGAFSEKWLQETLRRHPDVLPTDDIEPAFHPLIPIGREVHTEAGPIDDLFISYAGYLVVVETKLWRNPEARREVIAQLLDYASALARFTYDQVDAATCEYVKKYEGETCASLEEWVESRGGPVDAGFQSRVSRNLKQGRFLLLVVTDEERPAVADMLRRLSAQAWLPINIAVIVVRPFRKEGDPNLLLVPQILGRTEIVERTAVEITVNGATHQVVVEKNRSTEQPSGRTPLTSEVAFWELLRDRSPESEQPGHLLIDSFRRDEFELRLGEGSLIVDALIPDTDTTVPMFFLKSNGKVVFWPRTFARRTKAAHVDDAVGDDYSVGMLRLLGGTTKLGAYRPVQQVSASDLLELAVTFYRRATATS